MSEKNVYVKYTTSMSEKMYILCIQFPYMKIMYIWREYLKIMDILDINSNVFLAFYDKNNLSKKKRLIPDFLTLS